MVSEIRAAALSSPALYVTLAWNGRSQHLFYRRCRYTCMCLKNVCVSFLFYTLLTIAHALHR